VRDLGKGGPFHDWGGEEKAEFGVKMSGKK
jgi:hypothetical protein